MHIARLLVVLSLYATAPAWAQSALSPLNLKLPADAVPAQSNSVSERKPEQAAASTTQATPSAPLLPAPYEDTYGARRDAAYKGCDDVAYTQPQVHGSIGMGVAAGNHVNGNYQTGTIAATKALGSCDDPKGVVGASITVSKESINSRRRNRP